MSAPPASAGYVQRLSNVAMTSVAPLLRASPVTHRGEPTRRLMRQWLLTAALGGISVVVLMVWVDAWEITLMPPRGSEGLGLVRFFTNFGKDSCVLSVLGILLVATLLLAPVTHEPLQHRLTAMLVRLQFLFLAVALSLAVGELLKWVVGRGRPFVGGKANPFNFAPFAGTEAYASLPSAHSVTAFALAFAVAAAWPRARGLMIAYALVIAATRLVLLAHHPSDVVAGATIGIMGAMGIRYWFAVRGIGFAVGEGGMISPTAEAPLKGVAAGASAP